MTTTPKKTNPLKVILVAGLVAGTLDIIAACTQAYIKSDGKVGPERVLKYIARGVFGKGEGFSDNAMIAWGLLFHYIIATSFAALFVFLYLKWNLLSKNIVLSGLLYGVFVWVVMNRVVVPLSKIGPQPFVLKNAIIAMLILMFMIGLPIALITKKFYPKPAYN